MKTGIVRAIWLVMYREGGWWDTHDVEPHFKKMTHEQVRVQLHTMATKGHTVARLRQGNRTLFRVTKDCMVPHGITIKELRMTT